MSNADVCFHCGEATTQTGCTCPNGKIGILENRIMLLEEEHWCVHKWLDIRGAPREGADGTYLAA